MNQYTIAVQIIDVLMVGIFVTLVVSLHAANGRLRALNLMLAAIGLEVVFAGLSLFWPIGLIFVVIGYAGRVIEVAGIFAYLYRSRKSAAPVEALSGDRSVQEWEVRIRAIMKEELVIWSSNAA